MPNFRSAATAGSGDIVQYANRMQIDARAVNWSFTHEAGHNVYYGMGLKNAWTHRKRVDLRWVSRYARNAPTEDFADSFSLFIKARQAGKRLLALFRRRFPNRFEFLSRL
jgi:hypothetical protein